MVVPSWPLICLQSLRSSPSVNFWTTVKNTVTIHRSATITTIKNYYVIIALIPSLPWPWPLQKANHLGHFMLTLELLPTLLDTAGSCGDCRIIFVSSSAHGMANWEPENTNAGQQYSRFKFYCNSKLYNVSLWEGVVVLWHATHCKYHRRTRTHIPLSYFPK